MSAPPPPYRVRELAAAEASMRVLELSGVLVDCVEGGASVGFMAPLTGVHADEFWLMVVREVGEGKRILLIAEDGGGALVGTVQLLLRQPENQPHRAEIAKMLVRRHDRGRGVGAMLMRRAEEAARGAGKTLLLLDTVTGSDAERLYTRLGWIRVGVVPGYALMPDGRPCDTTIFYRVLEPSP